MNPTFLPRPVHRLALRVAHRVRHHWRRLLRPKLRGVSMILRDTHGHVLFVRHAYGPAYWALPGGGMESGEDPHETAQRELREELGIDLDHLDCIGTLEETISGAPHTAWVFTAVIEEPVVPDGREIVEVLFAPLDDPPMPLGPLAATRLAKVCDADKE